MNKWIVSVRTHCTFLETFRVSAEDEATAEALAMGNEDITYEATDYVSDEVIHLAKLVQSNCIEVTRAAPVAHKSLWPTQEMMDKGEDNEPN